MGKHEPEIFDRGVANQPGGTIASVRTISAYVDLLHIRAEHFNDTNLDAIRKAAALHRMRNNPESDKFSQDDVLFTLPRNPSYEDVAYLAVRILYADDDFGKYLSSRYQEAALNICMFLLAPTKDLETFERDLPFVVDAFTYEISSSADMALVHVDTLIVKAVVDYAPTEALAQFLDSQRLSNDLTSLLTTKENVDRLTQRWLWEVLGGKKLVNKPGPEFSDRLGSIASVELFDSVFHDLVERARQYADKSNVTNLIAAYDWMHSSARGRCPLVAAGEREMGFPKFEPGRE
jgi:hypothetical protein